MRDQNGMTRFDRVVGEGAWRIFWTVIGGICLVLKIYYMLRPTSRRANTSDTTKLTYPSERNNLEIESQTSHSQLIARPGLPETVGDLDPGRPVYPYEAL